MNDLSTYLTSVRARIAARGWMVQFVGPTRVRPAFHYTVGLYPACGFEIITVGMDHRTGALVLGDLADRVRCGSRFAHGQTLSDVLGAGYAVTLLQVSDARAWLGIARLLFTAEGTPLPAWQVVHPDVTHHVPWERHYTGVPQPILALPPR